MDLAFFLGSFRLALRSRSILSHVNVVHPPKRIFNPSARFSRVELRASNGL